MRKNVFGILKSTKCGFPKPVSIDGLVGKMPVPFDRLLKKYVLSGDAYSKIEVGAWLNGIPCSCVLVYRECKSLQYHILCNYSFSLRAIH